MRAGDAPQGHGRAQLRPRLAVFEVAEVAGATHVLRERSLVFDKLHNFLGFLVERVADALRRCHCYGLLLSNSGRSNPGELLFSLEKVLKRSDRGAS